MLSGALSLEGHELAGGDAFTLPPGRTFELRFDRRSADGDASPETRWLEVSLPGTAGLSETPGHDRRATGRVER